MLGDEIKLLRETLDCSIGELANAVGVDVKTLLAWETGDLFPTKKHEDRLVELRTRGPTAIIRKPRGKAAKNGVSLLAEPRLWAVVRKLLGHPDFFAEVEKLAERYEDPAS
jgi:transcriptional regulator with XRE-family HTH domain